MDGVIFEETKPVPDGESVWVEVTTNYNECDVSKQSELNAMKLDAILARCNAVDDKLKVLETRVMSVKSEVTEMKKCVVLLNSDFAEMKKIARQREHNVIKF